MESVKMAESSCENIEQSIYRAKQAANKLEIFMLSVDNVDSYDVTQASRKAYGIAAMSRAKLIRQIATLEQELKDAD